MADVEGSMPVLAVTAAVGAFVLLFVLLCGIGRRQNDKSENGWHVTKFVLILSTIIVMFLVDDRGIGIFVP